MKRNVLRAAAGGLAVGAALSAWVALLRGLQGSALFDDISYGTLVGVYLAASTIGGMFVGLLFPLRRKIGGSVLMGVAGVFPLYLGFFLVEGTRLQQPTLENVFASLYLATIVGGSLGLLYWSDEYWRKNGDLPFPWLTFRRLLIVWGVAIAVAVGSFYGLSRLTSGWPFVAVIWTAFLFFAAPPAVALLLMMAWRRRRERPPAA